MTHFTHDTRNALEAKQEAQRIAFAPFVFQAARALRDLGLLAALDTAGDAGLRLPELQAQVGLSLLRVIVYQCRVAAAWWCPF